MDVKQAILLLQRYQNGDVSPGEAALIKEWYQRMADNGEWHWRDGEKETLEAAIGQSLLQRIRQEDDSNIRPLPPVHFLKRIRWVAAASIVLLLGTGSLFVFLHRPGAKMAQASSQQRRFGNDVAPGGDKATLTLSNGHIILLDSAADGVLARQGNVDVQKTANGRLAYNTSLEKPAALVYNTLTTPRGGQYQLTLPDGSAVWLDAASSIRYPVPFSGKERVVEITGEAYFEVVHDPKRPFRVKVNQVEVAVLGTHFNINAYDDESSMKTTLLEGAVKINDGPRTRLLAPGEQAQVTGNNPSGGRAAIKVINNADMEEVMAWKNGMFRFRGEGIETVMRQVARWYNVQVEYQRKLPDYPFVGTIPRNVPVSELLRLLELTDVVHFTIEGNKITVIP
jgi:transmembrane sensor